MELTIEGQKRTPGSKPNALRRQGLLPAVLYGHKGVESVAFTVNGKAAESLVKEASVNNTLIRLKITDLPWSGRALLREIQTHPWRGSLYHLSFFSVAKQDSLEVTVPLNFVGEAIGVKEEGGVLDTVMNELQVQCAPDDIPEVIEVDVSNLKLGDSIHLQELVLPEKVTAIGEPEQMVVSVLPPRTLAAEAAEEETAAPDVAETLEIMYGEED